MKKHISLINISWIFPVFLHKMLNVAFISFPICFYFRKGAIKPEKDAVALVS